MLIFCEHHKGNAKKSEENPYQPEENQKKPKKNSPFI